LAAKFQQRCQTCLQRVQKKFFEQSFFSERIIDFRKKFFRISTNNFGTPGKDTLYGSRETFQGINLREKSYFSIIILGSWTKTVSAGVSKLHLKVQKKRWVKNCLFLKKFIIFPDFEQNILEFRQKIFGMVVKYAFYVSCETISVEKSKSILYILSGTFSKRDLRHLSGFPSTRTGEHFEEDHVFF